MKDVADLFWKQLAWVQPESYLADGEGPALFATRDAALFELVIKRS